MPYDSSSGVLTAPLSLYDIQQAIDTTSDDTAVLCSSSNINIWAKWKPIGITSYGLSSATYPDTPHRLDETYYSASKYGIKMYSGEITSVDVLLAGGSTMQWQYIRPVIGTDWCRVSDFINIDDSYTASSHPRGYDKNAVPPIQFTFPSENIQSDKTYSDQSVADTQANNNKYAVVFIFGTGTSLDTRLTLADVFSEELASGESYYPGVIVYCEDGTGTKKLLLQKH